MNIPLDKQLHIFSAWALAASLRPFTGSAMAWLIVTVLAVLKELIWDWALRKGTPDPMDAAASSAGALIAVLFDLTATAILIYDDRF